VETQGFEPSPDRGTSQRPDNGQSGQSGSSSPFESVVVPPSELSPLDPEWTPQAEPAQADATVVPGLLPPTAAPPVEAAAADGGLTAFAPSLPQEFAMAPEPGAPAQLAAEPVTAAAAEATEAAYHRAPIEEDGGVDGVQLQDLLLTVLERGGSDLHITAGARPMIRLHGSLQPLEDRPILTPPIIQRMLYTIITQKQREKFEENLELDFAYAVPGRARFRVNIYRQREALGAAFRLIPFEIKKLEDLGIPPAVANFAMLPRGFVLVTGPTGSGKSTTLASILDLANRQRRDHIMTVEDPIEFLHRHQASLVNQREVGEDTHSFQNALKHVLRQDPDIILVGEMRDLETISVALTAAETGHLVYATLHTSDAAQTIDRVIDVFPPHQQQQIRVQLAAALQGVVCQALCKTTDGQGRVVATEILVATPAIRNLIREGKTHQIATAMQAGAKFGMHTMDQHLAELVKANRITYETALEKCHHVEDFNRLCGRA
jgi:twitching motility protein PilT